jgi:hypothetical protein
MVATAVVLCSDLAFCWCAVMTVLCLLHLQYGCLVVNAPTANTVAAAEHGIALMCSLARNIAQADASMKQGKWERNKFVGASLVDKTLAIMGFGKVGNSCRSSFPASTTFRFVDAVASSHFCQQHVCFPCYLLSCCWTIGAASEAVLQHMLAWECVI